MSGDERGSTTSPEEWVDRIVEDHLDDLHVALVARVVSYDSIKQRCDAQPVTRRRYGRFGDRRSEQHPVIKNVPVAFASGGGFAFTFPLQAGDHVLLVFNERSYDEWLTNGGSNIDPQSERRHHITDAMAIPGVVPFNDPRQSAGDIDLELGEDVPGGKRLTVGPTGIGLGDGTNDVLKILDDTLALLLSWVDTNADTPNPATVALITAARAKLAVIKRP